MHCEDEKDDSNAEKNQILPGADKDKIENEKDYIYFF